MRRSEVVYDRPIKILKYLYGMRNICGLIEIVTMWLHRIVVMTMTDRRSNATQSEALLVRKGGLCCRRVDAARTSPAARRRLTDCVDFFASRNGRLCARARHGDSGSALREANRVIDGRALRELRSEAANEGVASRGRIDGGHTRGGEMRGQGVAKRGQHTLSAERDDDIAGARFAQRSGGRGCFIGRAYGQAR